MKPTTHKFFSTHVKVKMSCRLLRRTPAAQEWDSPQSTTTHASENDTPQCRAGECQPFSAVTQSAPELCVVDPEESESSGTSCRFRSRQSTSSGKHCRQRLSYFV